MRALDLAIYIVNKCVDDNVPITNLVLNKLLYIIQRESLTWTRKPAFNDTIVYTRKDGFPKVVEVYYHFCGWGAMPISSKVQVRNKIVIPNKSFVDKIVEEEREKKPWELNKDILRVSKAITV